jgi:hypothetical protein
MQVPTSHSIQLQNGAQVSHPFTRFETRKVFQPVVLLEERGQIPDFVVGHFRGSIVVKEESLLGLVRPGRFDDCEMKRKVRGTRFSQVRIP